MSQSDGSARDGGGGKKRGLVGRVFVAGAAVFGLVFRMRSLMLVWYLLPIGSCVVGVVSAEGGFSGRLAWANASGAADERAACLAQNPVAYCLARHTYGRAEIGTAIVGRPLRPVPAVFDPDTYTPELLRPLPTDAEAAAVLFVEGHEDAAYLGALITGDAGATLVRFGTVALSVDDAAVRVVPVGVAFSELAELPADPTRPWDYALAIFSGAAAVTCLVVQLSSVGASRSLRPAPALQGAVEPVVSLVLLETTFVATVAVFVNVFSGTPEASALHVALGCIVLVITLQSLWTRIRLENHDMDLTWLVSAQGRAVSDARTDASPGAVPTSDSSVRNGPLTLDDVQLFRAVQEDPPGLILERHGFRLRDQPLDGVTVREALRMVWEGADDADTGSALLVERVLQRAWLAGDCVFPELLLARLRELQDAGFLTVHARTIELRTPALEALAMPSLWYVEDVPLSVRQAIAEADGLLSAGRGPEAVIRCGRMVEEFTRAYLFDLLPDSLSSGRMVTTIRPMLAPQALKLSDPVRVPWGALWPEVAASVVPDEALRARVDALHARDAMLVVTALTTRLKVWGQPAKEDPALPDWFSMNAAKSEDRETLKALHTAVGGASRRTADEAYERWRMKVVRSLGSMQLAGQLAVVGALFSDSRLGSAANALGSDPTLDAVADELARDVAAPVGAVEHTAQAVRTLRNEYAHARPDRSPRISVRDAYHMIWLSRVFVSMCVQRQTPGLGVP